MSENSTGQLAPVIERAATWVERIPDSVPAPGPDLMVGLDIDGTLLHYDGDLSAEIRGAVAALHEAGTHVILATGRGVTATVPVAHALGLDETWAVSSNGAVMVQLSQGEYEITDVVTFDPGPAVRALASEMPDLLFGVEDIGRGFKVTAPFPTGELTGEIDVVDLDELVATPATRVTVRAPDLDSDDFYDLVARVGLHGVSYAVGWAAWLDLTPPGVSKASALEGLRGRFDVRPGATVTLGDGQNDEEMLQWAAHGVAMGDAPDHVVAVADAQTGGVAADGAAVVLRALAMR